MFLNALFCSKKKVYQLQRCSKTLYELDLYANHSKVLIYVLRRDSKFFRRKLRVLRFRYCCKVTYDYYYYFKCFNSTLILIWSTINCLNLFKLFFFFEKGFLFVQEQTLYFYWRISNFYRECSQSNPPDPKLKDPAGSYLKLGYILSVKKSKF